MDTLNLLIPIDNTPFSHQIVEQVVRLFPPERVAIVLLNVRPLELGYQGSGRPRYGYGSSGQGGGRHTFDKEGLDAASRAMLADLEQEVERFLQLGYRASARVYEGQPVEVITREANGGSVDVIAMTTHGRTGLGQMLVGSVAQAVVAKVTVPVVLLRGDPG